MSTLKLSNDIEYRRYSDFEPQATVWQDFPATLVLRVRREEVHATYDEPGGVREAGRYEDWLFDQAKAETYLPRILKRLKIVRENHSDYFDHIGETFEQDLAGYDLSDGWGQSSTTVDVEHLAAWDRVSRSGELWDLAKTSYQLYNAVFPKGTWLRETLDRLPLGSMLDILWSNVDGHVMNVPWGLLYQVEPGRGQPIDPEQFWGLRYRIDNHPYSMGATKLSLGERNQANVGHAYYWKGLENDRALQEANWQKEQFSTVPTHVAMPTNQAAPKDQLIQWLEKPNPHPMPVLYLFCKAKSDDEEPRLEFGHDNTNREAVTIRLLDLPSTPFDDVRFVFFNACETSQKQAGEAFNLLESHFFERGCWAFLGTVHETPIGLASKFAAIFFHFFYGRGDQPMLPAGEACVHAKRFLWLKYRNIGGLFYNYVNEYALSLVHDAENDTRAPNNP